MPMVENITPMFLVKAPHTREVYSKMDVLVLLKSNGIQAVTHLHLLRKT
jgi:hypothetical protein